MRWQTLTAVLHVRAMESPAFWNAKAVLSIRPKNGQTVLMGYQRKDAEKTKQYAKKFVRYKEGAEKYSLGLTKFQALAKEAKAVYKIDGIALVNCEIFEKFLETFREC